MFGLAVIVLAGLLTLLWVKDTLPWAQAEGAKHAAGMIDRTDTALPDQHLRHSPTTWEVFTLMSWRDKRMAPSARPGWWRNSSMRWSGCSIPVFLYQHGLSLASIGWVVGVYGFVWGGSQFFTGKLSDHIGRQKPIVRACGSAAPAWR